MSAETITVKILFFGAAADIAGTRETEMSFLPDTAANTAFENVLRAFPGLGNGLKSSLLFAVNQEYANGDETLSEGDELAVIPPVSGG